MSRLRVLFIGGTGVISSACSALAVQSGIDLYVLNRGRSRIRPLPAGVREIQGDINADTTPVMGKEFDCVVNWVAFTAEQVLRDVGLFRDRTGQYVFISSASAYQTPPARVPVTESTPLRNPYWQYSRDKIACEDALTAAYRDNGFPATIVRPSHTYDRTLVPFDGGWTVLGRMLAGQQVIVHGDGTSLWTLTHHEDFARAFVPLLGHPPAVGDTFQITSEDALTWDQIAHTLAAALGTTARITHVPSDAIAKADPEWGAGLLGDKAHSMLFDNSKIRTVVPGWRAVIPFERGAREIADWYLADPARQVTDERLDAVMDTLAREFVSSELLTVTRHVRSTYAILRIVPMINVCDLRMRYGSHDVLTGVTFSVARGEVVALLGPNGAGKTTTIEILEGFRKPSAGEVRVLDADPARGTEAWRARIGVVLQSWRDHGKWRVRELLAHLGSYYAPYRSSWDVDELLSVAGLTGQGGAKVKQLSGGQRRRLDVAIGIVGRPELIFLDEPTAGFDPEARREFHDLVHRLTDREQATILLTTHDLDEAEKLADRILVLAGGRIVADGSADKLTQLMSAEAEVRWTRDGQRFVHSAAEPTRFVRELLRQYGESVDDLEVRRASLEDAYIALVREYEGVSR